MSITSSITVHNGCYGYWKSRKDGSTYFFSYGNAPYLDTIYKDLESQRFLLRLQVEYLHETQTIIIPKGNLTNISCIDTLANAGFDITKKSHPIFQELIRLQEDEYILDKNEPIPYYTHLGWIDVPDKKKKIKTLFRADKLVGAKSGKYNGRLAVKPSGDFHIWKKLIDKHVLGYPNLELTVIASLASIVNGLLGLESPIVHYHCGSSTGKTTAAYLATSVFGPPFEGTRKVTDPDGMIVEEESCLQSWGATPNALIASLAGNNGVVTVLNELGKCNAKNFDELIFFISEGSEKKRLSKDLDTRLSERFSTVVISNGEESLLEQCKRRKNGLNVRVMEIKTPLTSSATQSKAIKACCSRHNGHAGPIFAQYILEHGGKEYVQRIYNRWKNLFSQRYNSSALQQRFAEKFYCLFMATAEIAQSALGIKFDLNRLLTYFDEYEASSSHDRNMAWRSYQEVIDFCKVNIAHFHTKNFPATGDVYGKIITSTRTLPDGRHICAEYLLYQPVLAEFLKHAGYPDPKTCAQFWTEINVLNRDKDRPTRSRYIGNSSTSSDVYCFWEFTSAPPQRKQVHSQLLNKADDTEDNDEDSK